MQTSEELKQQLPHYKIIYYPVKAIMEGKKRNEKFELLMKWLGFVAGHGKTWELLSTVKQDEPGVMKVFSQDVSNQNLRKQIIDLKFQ